MPITDPGVARALENVRAKAQALLAAVDDAEAAMTGDPDPAPTATVHTMTVGGWMQLPGSPRWRPIAAITKCAASPLNCWRIDFDLKSTDPDGTCVHVNGLTEYPFLTAEQFDRDCTREQEKAA